jgi:hypothetical protein
MTGPLREASPLYQLLGLYAALDRAVMESDDPGIEATVEQFLPGTTGENAGWSENLAEFVGGLPSLDEVLNSFADNAADTTLSAPEKSRLGYVLGAISHIPRYRESGNSDRISTLLSLTAQQGFNAETGAPLFEYLTGNFNQRQDWVGVAAYAAQPDRQWLDPIAAKVPLCNAWLTTVDGIDCVVVDTVYEDPDTDIDEVKYVVDPRNWSTTAGRYFCEMVPIAPHTTDGWGRVVETVSPWCYMDAKDRPAQLVTDLRYLKTEQSPFDARLHYDLDDYEQFPGQGDGQVTVDRGYINMRTLVPGVKSSGVRIVTKKVVHIEGLWPVAQKIFVCAMGYGHAAVEMLVGDQPKHAVPWDEPPVLETPKDASSALAADAPPPPANEPKTAASLAVTMIADCLEDATKDSSALAQKWTKNNLTFADLMTFSARYGARMASDPWRFLQKLGELPPPPQPHGSPEDRP